MNLRQRMVVAALVPVALVAVVLTGFFLFRHLADLDRAQEQKGIALIRQAAEIAEFQFFAGNRDALLATAQTVLRTDEDVSGVAMAGPDGNIIAQTGSIAPAQWPPLSGSLERRLTSHGLVMALPVMRTALAVDDAYSGVDFAVAARPQAVLGHVILAMSGQRLARERERLMTFAVFVALGGLLLGSWLALRIARAITVPVVDATDVVTRIGHGDIKARLSVRKSGPLQMLAQGINAMAERVAMTREELEAQVRYATAELVRQRDAAEQATDTKSRFLAAASHDLRQPLHAMGLFVARLQSLALRGEAQGLVRQVQDSVTTLQDMLDTLLDLSRLDAGGMHAEPCEFDLSSVLSRVCREMAPVAHEKQIDLRIRARPAWVRSDPRLVARVASNLIANALRYTVQGRVLVACRSRGGQVRLQVWDTGVGIPPGQQAKIFDEYVQIGNEERDRGKGLGLGLTICHRIARLLDTEIGLRSVPGRGSVFWVDLPAATAGQPASAPPGEAAAAFSGPVLVVDDNPLCRTGTAELLAGWGAEVRMATSGDEARSLLVDAGFAPRYAICDVRLPGGEDGIVLGQHLCRVFPGLEVLLVSADVSPVILARARRAGFPLLRKPVPPARLRAVLLSRGPLPAD